MLFAQDFKKLKWQSSRVAVSGLQQVLLVSRRVAVPDRLAFLVPLRGAWFF
ncbi:hypothetical protein J0X19_10360 [Hymenobacter sp. BT186]|uniref:Uncharacterized protein n=1 Tax=Hymenobacter telluris TaxID=2816474 RepID=A0A939JDH1_9BACT|nr:hypothetical protein [Hymenobacter telluris]MBO0358347.1 hypothetical protein [Hymenobacter telluris]MBW3374373.1 hypothetical protein [Hymenobacter norwichensis]